MVCTRRTLVFLVLGTVLLLAPSAAAQDLNPDLAVVSIGTEADSPSHGEKTNFTATIRNEGDGNADGFDYNFTLNGEQFGPDQTYDQQVGNDDTVTVTSEANWTVEAGVHLLNVTIVPHDGLQDDQNPSNDARERTIEIGPDLVASNLKATPKNPIEGQGVAFSVKLANEGNRSAPNFGVDLLIDGVAVDNATIGGLDAGNSQDLTLSWKATEGSHDVEISVDPEDDVPEIVEGDTITSSIDVAPALPDLRVENLTFRPDPPKADQDTRISVTVVNDGRAKAQNTSIQLSSPNVSQPFMDVPELAPGGSADVSWIWQAQGGVHDVSATVDPSKRIEETDEDNNEISSEIAVGPDLKIKDVSIRPPNANASDRVQFTATVVNKGAATDATVNVAFTLGNETLEAQPLRGLDENQPQQVTTEQWVAESGDHEIVALVDPGDDIAETDEENNDHSLKFTIGEPNPDLTVLSTVFSPSRPEAGNETTIITQVRNTGLRDASNVVVNASIDGDEVARTTIDKLARQSQTTARLGNWTAEEGLHELHVTVDPEEQVTEGDEANNTFKRLIGVGRDLTVDALAFAPPEPEPGEKVTLQVTAVNNGTQTTRQTQVVFEADDREIARVDVPRLTSGETTEVRANWTATNARELSASIDPSDVISEYDEANNRQATEITLPNATGEFDLTVRGIAWDQESLENGDTASFTAIVENVGTAASPATTVSFAVDGVPLGAPVSVTSLAPGGLANATSSEWNVSRGEHTIEASVDPTGELAEVNESNNTLTTSLDPGPTGIPAPTLAALAAIGVAAWARRSRDR